MRNRVLRQTQQISPPPPSQKCPSFPTAIVLRTRRIVFQPIIIVHLPFPPIPHVQPPVALLLATTPRTLSAPPKHPQPLLPLHIQSQSCQLSSRPGTIPTSTSAIALTAPPPRTPTETAPVPSFIALHILSVAAVENETAPEAAVGGLNPAPGLLAQAENQRVDEAHQADAQAGADAQGLDGVVSVLVPVVHAVQGEGDEPHERVDERVDEDEAELAVDALAAFGLAELAAALHRWGGDMC